MMWFVRGQRVRLTEAGVRQGLGRPGQTGTVWATPRQAERVQVVRDGNRYPCTYHVDFWMPDAETCQLVVKPDVYQWLMAHASTD